MYHDSRTDGWRQGPLYGIENYFLEYVAQKLNFTFELINCRGVWGVQVENGSFNGIIGLVQRKVSCHALASDLV